MDGASPGPRGGAYQLEADRPVLPVHLGVVVPYTGRRAASRAGWVGRGRSVQALQGVRKGPPEVAGAAAAGPRLDRVGGVVFVEVKERLFRDAVQLFQLLFNFSVSETANGEEIGLGVARRP